ncbi:hypothetical protein LINGRAHAP2_LOCUS33609 [Linum grandiflorum]
MLLNILHCMKLQGIY